MRTLANSILKLEQELEIAMEEILNDFSKQSNLQIKNIKLFKEHDDQGPYYKFKVITSVKNEKN